MTVRLAFSLGALLAPGGAGSAVATRRLILPSLATAAMPQGTDAAGPAVHFESAALFPQF